jgi:hypothetical protein
MTKPNVFPESDDPDKIIRKRILERAETLNADLMQQIAIAASDLTAGEYRAALGGLEGIERQLTTIRSILLLLP